LCQKWLNYRVVFIYAQDINLLTIKIGGVFTDPGANASDSFDTSVSSSSIITSGTVDTGTVGTYVITYSATDASENTGSTTRTVNVIPLGTNSSLSALSSALGVMSPSFSSSTLAYTVILPFGTTATPATFATTSDSFATASTTNAVNVTSATSSDRTTTIVVTAEDGIATTTYTITYSVAFQEVVTPVVTFFGGGGGRSGGSRILPILYGPAIETGGELPTRPLAGLVTPAFAAEPGTVTTAGGATSTENVAGNTETGNEALAAAVAGSTGLSWWWILLIALVLLGLIWYFWALYKRRSKDDGEQQINQ
jgi:hypothetical protein